MKVDNEVYIQVDKKIVVEYLWIFGGVFRQKYWYRFYSGEVVKFVYQ